MTQAAANHIRFSVSHSSMSEPQDCRIPLEHGLSSDDLLDDLLTLLNFKDPSNDEGPKERNSDRTFMLRNRTRNEYVSGAHPTIREGDHLELEDHAISA
jgi:hypothetical protein